MYGYLGFFGSRFYCFDCANEVTLKGREQIQDVINILEEKKYEIIYGDTDSIFVYLDKKKTEPLNDIVSKINEKLPDLMELSIQDIYPKAIFVAAKGSLKGAKKKYALITKEDKIVIKGFAAIRRNWSKLAKEVQKEVLKIILTTNDTEKALKYIKEIIADLRSNKVPTKKMSISTQITKPIDDYDSIGPHVAVAIKLRNKGIEVKPGDIIKYIVKKGAGRIGDKSYPEDSVSQEEYDGEYYIMNQILPSVEEILRIFNINKEDILSNNNQNTLSKFF